jgi:hypothetical protein
MADELGLGPSGRKVVGVQVSPGAPIFLKAVSTMGLRDSLSPAYGDKKCGACGGDNKVIEITIFETPHSDTPIKQRHWECQNPHCRLYVISVHESEQNG